MEVNKKKTKRFTQSTLSFWDKGVTKIVGSKNKIENLVWYTHSENFNNKQTTKQ